MPDDQRSSSRRLLPYAVNAVIAAVLYSLSSGPVLGLAFWLRERTGVDQFYAVFWLYYPLIRFQHPNWLVGKYIEWWVVNVFKTVGPG